MEQQLYLNGACSPERKKELKEQYQGKQTLYKCEFTFNKATHDVILKVLSAEDLKLAKMLGNVQPGENVPQDIPEWIVKIKNQEDRYQVFLVWRCVLFPVLKEEHLSSLPIGVIPSLVYKLEQKSGFEWVNIMGKFHSTDTTSLLLSLGQNTGMLTSEEELEIAKTVETPVCRVRIGRHNFLVTPLLRKHLDELEDISIEDRDTYICKSCCLYPKDLDWSLMEAYLSIKLAGVISNFSSEAISEVEEEEIL